MKIAVSIIPQDTVICDGCGYAMRPVHDYVKGSDGIQFSCRTSGCRQKHERIYIPFTRFSAESVGRDDA